MRYTFGKQERLCSQRLLDELFHSGHRLMVFPYSVHWHLCPADALPADVPCQVLIATSKKKFHHAVDRVRVKRLTRECYRLHKPQLYQYLTDNNLHLLLGINYVHNEIMDYPVLYRKFDKMMAQLTTKINLAQQSETPTNTPEQ